MNTHKFKFILLLVLGLGTPFYSCKDYLDVNVDPNQSTISRIDLQLSSSELMTAVGIGQRIYPQLSILAQYQTGGPGVSLGDPDQHKWASSEGNEVFRELYRSSANLNYIIQNSTDNNYVAIAKVLRAYNFQVNADLFGDIPYTQALKGDIADGSILHPVYDSAKDVVYPGIENELREAIDLIDRGGVVTPAADDLIYGGDMEKWNKFAHSLLLKVYLRQGASGQAKAAQLYTSNDQFILTNDEAAQIQFYDVAGQRNPQWNAAKSTALGNFYVATSTATDYLTATGDPRLDAYYDPTADGPHYGLYPGDIQAALPTQQFSRPAGALAPAGGLMFGPDNPVILLSAWESNLLLAEAAARGWITADANALYDAAVQASFEYLGLDATAADAYLAAGGAYDAANAIKSIALQKWISMNNLQPVESWIEARRFDSPATPIFFSPGGIFHSPTKNALGTGIFPSILPYPESEESLNQSFPGQHSLTAKVFWDN
jgi:hypothetical protein